MAFMMNYSFFVVLGTRKKVTLCCHGNGHAICNSKTLLANLFTKAHHENKYINMTSSDPHTSPCRRRRRKQPNILNHPRAQQAIASPGARLVTSCHGGIYFCRTSNTTRIPLFVSHDANEIKTCSLCNVTKPLRELLGHFVSDGRDRYIIVMEARRMSNGDDYQPEFSARRCRNLHATWELADSDIRPLPDLELDENSVIV